MLKAKTYEDRERLVSALLTLRSFHFQGGTQQGPKPDLLRITADYSPVYEDI